MLLESANGKGIDRRRYWRILLGGDLEDPLLPDPSRSIHGDGDGMTKPVMRARSHPVTWPGVDLKHRHHLLS